MIVEINRRVLALAGFGAEHLTALRWQELLPKDPMTQANAALQLKQLGVSVDTLLQKLGHDPDAERKKREKETNLGKSIMDAFDRGGIDPEE